MSRRGGTRRAFLGVPVELSWGYPPRSGSDEPEVFLGVSAKLSWGYPQSFHGGTRKPFLRVPAKHSRLVPKLYPNGITANHQTFSGILYTKISRFFPKIFTMKKSIFYEKIRNAGISSETTIQGISSETTETWESRVRRRFWESRVRRRPYVGT